MMLRLERQTAVAAGAEYSSLDLESDNWEAARIERANRPFVDDYGWHFLPIWAARRLQVLQMMDSNMRVGQYLV